MESGRALIWGSYGQPPPPPPDGEEVDEIVQVFLERAAGGHLPFVPIPEDTCSPPSWPLGLVA